MVRDAARRDWSVVVAVSDDRVLGYATHGAHSDATGSVGLIAVDRTAQGLGVGSALLSAAVAAECQAGRGQMTVVTQGGSRPAMAMYQAAGFTVARLGLWLHWHRR